MSAIDTKDKRGIEGEGATKVEMIVCWDDGTWSDCHFVEVDGRVPAEEIPRVAEEKLLAELEETAEGGNLVVHVGVYHIEEADEHS